MSLAMLDACELAVALAGSAPMDDAIRTYLQETGHPYSSEMAGTVEQMGGVEGMIEVDDPGRARLRAPN